MPIFRFRTPPPDDRSEPLRTQKTASAWFRQLPAADAIGRQQIVMRTIATTCRPGSELEFEHVGVIEFLDAELAADRGRLITQYALHADGSAAVANRIWQAAYEISQGFTVAYRTLLDRALPRANDRQWKEAIPRLTARLIHFYGTDAKLRVLKTESWIPAKWMELHRLYARAIDLGIARTPLGRDATGSGAARPTIEQEYLAVLLTHLLNTGTLPPGEVDWAAVNLRLWTVGLELDASPRAANGFVVDLAGKTGLVRRSGAEAGAMLRYLDTGPLAEQLDRATAALWGRVAGDPKAAGPINRQRIATLEKLRSTVSPEAPPAVPRDPRTGASVAAQVRTGLIQICQELGPSETGNAAIEMATGGEIVATPAGTAGPAPEAVATLTATPPGERLWRVANRSRTGLCLVALPALGQSLSLGMLVAVREPGGGDWVLGVVRRVARPTGEKVEAGVAIIAPRVIAVALHARCQAREDMGIVVDGVDVSTIGARFDGLYLMTPSRSDRSPAIRSLVIPTSEYGEGRNIILITTRTVYTVALGQLLEHHSDWTWVAIDIVSRTPRD